MNALSLVYSTAIPKSDREDTTLAGLVERLELRDAETLPDRTVQLSKVRMTANGTLVVPGVQGSYGLTEWARGQLSRTVGLNFGRYFSNARPTDVAEEMNRRFSRATETVKLRSVSRVSESTEATGTITALVSPDYSPVPDALVGGVLRDTLSGVNGDTKILRCTTTDLTTSYVVRVGERLTPNAEVGAVEGCLYVRNSGVGFAPPRRRAPTSPARMQERPHRLPPWRHPGSIHSSRARHREGSRAPRDGSPRATRAHQHEGPAPGRVHEDRGIERRTRSPRLAPRRPSSPSSRPFGDGLVPP